MARSAAFQSMARLIRIARLCDRHGLSTREGLERAAAAEAATVERGASRREFLGGAARLTTLGAIGVVAGPFGLALAAPRPPSGDVAIVGAGLAGLACGDELRQHGVLATIYEASIRAGGRCFSLGGAFPGPVDFPGQVVERGGEFIDTEHKTMIGYAHQFGLALEDVTKGHEDVFYYFFGRHHSESEVVDELRALVDAMRDDLRTVGSPTADSFTPADAVLDRTNLREYLETRNAGNLIKAVINVAYTIEYGLEIDRQSCLNFLLFIHADRRSRFTPFGVFSDERYKRYHVIGGNQQIPAGLAAGLGGQIRYGMALLRARKTSAGRVELTLQRGSSTVSATYDAVVVAIPFSVLREIELGASLGLPAWKLFAEHVGDEPQPRDGRARRADGLFRGRARRAARSEARTDGGFALPGGRGQGRSGCACGATRDARGNFLVHLEHWPSNPLTKGAYTCNQPGYFTTIADNEQKPVGNLFFAGEHTSSFYEAQGFMEGGVVSGLRAAAEVLRAL